MHCRGRLNDDEKEWNPLSIKKTNSRQTNEYRLHIYKSILNGAVDYYTGQFKKYKASKQKDPDAQQYLGFLYQHGYGTKKYSSVAISYYTKAAEYGLVAAQYNLGILYQQNTKTKFNYRKAFHWYTLAAKGGNVAAQNGLAYFYEKGLVTDINYLTAFHWYKEAANSGHSGAQITLGKWYRKGQSVEQDYNQAAEWYKLAASQGSQVAQNCLELLYQNGNIAEETVPEYSTGPSRKSRLCSKLRLDIELLDNDGINTELLKKLAMNASKGDGNAMYEIGLNYYNGTDFTQDKDIGFKWIRNAANADNKEAQFKLAETYKEGDVVEQDYHKRSIWTKRLAKKKDSVTQYNLGILYRRGLGVREDDLEASKWFILSSDQGNVDAMHELAEMKHFGLSFKPNEKEAEGLYYKSAIGGNMNACTTLARMYVEGDGEIEQDRDRGLKMYDSAARQGDARAQFELGNIYEYGEYIEADDSKASRYYSMIHSSYTCGSDFSLADKYLNEKFLTRDNKKAFFRFKMDEMGRLKIFRSPLFRTPIGYCHEITNYYNLIDMFIEVTKCGIDNLEYYTRAMAIQRLLSGLL
jgi:TPR repeat protein